MNSFSFIKKSFHNQLSLRTKKTKSFVVPKKNNFYEPKTINQEKYISHVNDPKIKLIIGMGSAGSGKTLLACQSAVKGLLDGENDKIIITRPVVPVEEDLGFLPGTINKKMDPWTRPLMDIFNDFHSKSNIKGMLKENTIEISPLGFMRGRTFKNAFIIADEMQNSSPNQMLMLLTRIGDNSKLVITGDLKQSDKEWSGLEDLIQKLKFSYENEEKMIHDGIAIIEFNEEDVQRSPLVKKILKIYNK